MSDMKEHDEHEINNGDTVNQADNDISTEDEEYMDESNPVDNDVLPEEEDYLPEGADYVANNTGVEHREEPERQEGVKSEENLKAQTQNVLSEETKPQKETAPQKPVKPRKKSQVDTSDKEDKKPKTPEKPAKAEKVLQDTPVNEEQPKANEKTQDKPSDNNAKDEPKVSAEQQLLNKIAELQAENAKRNEELNGLLTIVKAHYQAQEQVVIKKEDIPIDIKEIQDYMYQKAKITLTEDDPLIYSLLYTKYLFKKELGDYEKILDNTRANLDKSLASVSDFMNAVEENKRQFINSITQEHIEQRRFTAAQVKEYVKNAMETVLEENVKELFKESIKKAFEEAGLTKKPKSFRNWF